jgi:serine/threonine protein kinase
MFTFYKLSSIASGLEYLHSHEVIHGNLKGVCYRSQLSSGIGLTLGQPNILVDNSGRAQITDFGLAALTQNPASMQAFLDDQNARWTAPEILSDQGTYSKEADVFSLAMVMIEVRYGRPAVSNMVIISLQHRCSLPQSLSMVVYLRRRR